MFKFYSQFDQMDCGPVCLKMIAKHYGKNVSLKYLRDNSFLTKTGVSLAGINHAAKEIAFDTSPFKLSVEKLIKNKDKLPCILHWNQNHFVVLIKITKSRFSNTLYFHVADPAHGKIKLTFKQFKDSWLKDETLGIALLLHPSDEFDKLSFVEEKETNFSDLYKYLLPYKRYILGFSLSILVASLITLIFPFLTQTLIDEGVENKNLKIVYAIIGAQIFLYIGTLSIDIIRNWIAIFLGTRVNISIISAFLTKLFRLPIKFFDTKLLGDFQQRIQDQERINEFLTSQSLLTFFSLMSFSIFFLVLLKYNTIILLVYLTLTAISVAWSVMFLKRRKHLDYQQFNARGETRESTLEIFNGIHELRLNNFGDYKLNVWNTLQLKLFKINLKILKLDQFQLIGYNFLNEVKNILVTFIAAYQVIAGNLTIGAMLAISYIIGQMNSPINQLVAFIRSLQDAKLSLNRLNEIQKAKEEDFDLSLIDSPLPLSDKKGSGIVLENIAFQYEGPLSPRVLDDINLTIKDKEVTAVVGASGSGKTTLLKLLLKFYPTTEGEIYFNDKNIKEINAENLRQNIGVVMQDGFIFSDTIERNIATSHQDIDEERLVNAIKLANLEDFILSLPLQHKTKIGPAGIGLSGGEKQRILIARVIYKDPSYIFLDEATSSLDAENEKIIHDNLQTFFIGKTVVIIAHRLSTVKSANTIIVLDKGNVAEKGNHQDLVDKKGKYYNLIKNQLELGN